MQLSLLELEPQFPVVDGGKKQRIANDFYPTRDAEKLVGLLRRHVNIEGLVLEPCAGDGAIASQFERCNTNDLIEYPGCKTTWQMDATDWDSWLLWSHHSWTITNPPFSLANAIIPMAWNWSTRGMAMLLRLSWLEPTSERADWLAEYSCFLSHLIIVNPRPRFRSDTRKTDSVTVAWMVWQKQWQGKTNVVFENGWR